MPGARRAAETAGSGRIEKSDPLPYYSQLTRILREQILAGVWKPGERLPSEGELGATYGLSRTAIRQALGQLVAEHLVVKEKGRGSFVSRPRLAEFVVQELRGFYEEMQEAGYLVRTEPLAQRLTRVPPEVAPYLGVAMDSEVVQLDRLRLVDEEPMVLVTTYLPYPRFAALLELDLREESLYALLSSRFALRSAGGFRHVEATLATAEAAATLRVRRGSPLLRLSAVNLDEGGAAFEWFSALYRGDRTCFQLSVGPRSDLGPGGAAAQLASPPAAAMAAP
jgi:GntR family transcriptional regulator